MRAAQECERERAALDRSMAAAAGAGRSGRRAVPSGSTTPSSRRTAWWRGRWNVHWEEALLAQRSLEEEYRRFQQEQPVQLSAAERRQIEALARELPALWQAPTTSVVEKRQVVRLLLQRVVVWAPASSQEVKVQLHWTGGTVTEHQVLRPVRAWEQVADAADLWRQAQEWQAAGWTSRRMAEELNARVIERRMVGPSQPKACES